MSSRFRARVYHPLWRNFPESYTIHLSIPYCGPATPTPRCWFGLFPVRSPLLGESRLFSFPSGTEMFHFPEYRSIHPMYSGAGNQVFILAGFSHSEIFGLKCICHYPKLIAAYHVLHRHPMPRHSPCAFCNLIIIFYIPIISIGCNLYTLSMQFSKNCGHETF